MDEKTEHDAFEQLSKLIQQKEKEGKVVFKTIDGLMEADIEEFIKQPTQGLLYDLNRDKVSTLHYEKNPRWINDYAVAVVITKLKEYYDRMNNEI